MKLYQLVLRDSLARKRRVLFAALGVIIGTMTVVGILTIAQAGKNRIYNQLERYGPNLTVIPAISNLDMKLGNLSLGTLSVGENYIAEAKLPQVRQITDSAIKRELDIKGEGEIATIAPKLYVNTQVKGMSVMAVGIDPEAELAIKTWWMVEKGAYIKEENQALAGAIAARLLGIEVGDTITLNSQKLVVSGILEETGSNDDYQIFVPLVTLQKAFNKEGLISSVDIRALCNACPVTVIADEINQNIPGVRGVAVKQVAETEMGMVERVNTFMLALAGITLLVGLFGVGNTMMASVHERIKDIGIMRAVGASRNQVVKLFIYEAIIVGIIGGILGYVVGTLLAFGIAPLVFEGAAISYTPVYLLLSLALSILVASLATLYPAFHATQIKVADSFRSL